MMFQNVLENELQIEIGEDAISMAFTVWDQTGPPGEREAPPPCWGARQPECRDHAVQRFATSQPMSFGGLPGITGGAWGGEGETWGPLTSAPDQLGTQHSAAR